MAYASGLKPLIIFLLGYNIYYIGSALVIIAGLLTSLSPNFLSLLIFRGIVGFGIGGSTIAFDILAEFLPTDQRGSFLIYIGKHSISPSVIIAYLLSHTNLLEFFWTFGSIFVATVAWLVLSSYGWRAMVFICSIPAGMSLLVSIIFVPESPRWLLSQERTEECKSILKMIATTNSCEGGIPPSYILRSTASECGDDVTSKGGGSASKSWYDFMMPNVKVFFALEIVWFSFGFGYYGLILFLSKIYENFSNSGTTTEPEQETCHFQYADMFVSAVFELVGLIIGIFLISRYGRVSLQCFGFAACGVCVVAMAVTPHHSTLNLLIGLCARMSMMISSCVAWVQTPELFKTEHRARGHTMAVAASRVGSFIVPYFINSATNELTSALILGGVLLLAASSVLFLPETKGDNLYSICMTQMHGRVYYNSGVLYSLCIIAWNNLNYALLHL